MIEFEEDHDPIFLAILHEALELRIETIRELLHHGEPEEWAHVYPHLAPYFSLEMVVAICEQLLVASRHPRTIYRLTDYHWMLLYDVLRVFCDIHNDYSREQPDSLFQVGPYRVGPIDFDALLDFFFDLDFQITAEEFHSLSPAQVQSLGVTKELPRLINGLPPNAEDLCIEPLEEAEEPSRDAEPVPPPGAVIPRYPFDEEGEEEAGQEG